MPVYRSYLVIWPGADNDQVDKPPVKGNPRMLSKTTTQNMFCAHDRTSVATHGP
jgi:hypothetical protein